MTPAIATFMEEGKKDTKFRVHFNPASLKLAITNTIPDEGGGGAQTKSKSSSKLDLELIFDSTDDGTDVRLSSNQLKDLGFLTKSSKALPKVVFDWGTFSFTGIIESLNETFEFFSSQGVPLRETVAVSMKGLKLNEKHEKKVGDGSSDSTVPSNGGSRGTTGIAQGLGNPSAGRDIAAQNGLESMRFPGSASLSVDMDVSLQGPAGLSLPERGVSIDAGSVFGGMASAGVSANAGAFAGLGAKVSTGGALKLQFDPLPQISNSSNFDLTGRISAKSSTLFNMK